MIWIIIMIFCCTSARVFLKWNSSYSSLILLLLSIYLAYLSRKCGEECSSILIISFLCILIFWLFSSSCKSYFKYNLDYDLNIFVPRVSHLTAPKRWERMGLILLLREKLSKIGLIQRVIDFRVNWKFHGYDKFGIFFFMTREVAFAL